MKRLPMLDLFSGIGGFSYALQSVCRTVGYCEIDVNCKEVLTCLMKNKSIDHAFIHEDVTQMVNDSKVRPLVITGGFPCHDLSVMAPHGGDGIFGERSKLFFDMVSVIKKHPSTQVVFIENSPSLLHRGWREVTSALHGAGFSQIAYGKFSASEVGGLHRRTRLFCIACKKGAQSTLQQLASVTDPDPGYRWANKEPCQRLLCRGQNTQSCNVRCMMLGNSVVPQVVAHACRQLSMALLDMLQPKGAAQQHVVHVQSGSHKHSFAKKFTQHDSPSPPLRVMQHNGKKIVHSLWMTPVHSSWHQYRRVTARGSRLLSNQIYYDDDTSHAKIDTVPKHLRSTAFVINPCFIEYLMGYPLKWTNGRCP
jgi:site-specific DNA-cytosine methylase